MSEYISWFSFVVVPWSLASLPLLIAVWSWFRKSSLRLATPTYGVCRDGARNYGGRYRRSRRNDIALACRPLHVLRNASWVEDSIWVAAAAVYFAVCLRCGLRNSRVGTHAAIRVCIAASRPKAAERRSA